jgi:translation initiation factor IF-1
MANNPLETFGSEIVAGLLGSVNLRDYQDAARTFLPGNYARIPKFKSWFHVYFELNQGVAANIRGSLGNLNGGPNARFNWFKQAGDEEVFGILVKNVRLPGFKFDVKTHNQYNRKNLVLNKINYEPIDIEFHDDISIIIKIRAMHTKADTQVRIKELRFPMSGASLKIVHQLLFQVFIVAGLHPTGD